MEYFRCNVAQSLPAWSFGLFIYKREIDSGHLNLDLAHVGTQLFDFGNCYVYLWKQRKVAEAVTGP